MNKQAVVSTILKDKAKMPMLKSATAFAPSNIALCKYWGKRNTELNLPVTSSLSISLGNYGAKTSVTPMTESEADFSADNILVNGVKLDNTVAFAKKLTHYLDLFRPTPRFLFQVETSTNIPIGAGLASSACGFAALALALDKLFAWELPLAQLSILGRLGSGSATRSFWNGFVEWQAGVAENGMDSMGVLLKEQWLDLRIGLLILNPAQKKISSRDAMQNSVLTSPYYAAWPKKHAVDLARLKTAIANQDFWSLGETAESNALAMHALMLTSSPPCYYSEGETLLAMQQVWQARNLGLPLFFTQDAGPNLKLLFLEKDSSDVLNLFPNLQVIAPFKSIQEVVL